MPLPSACEPSAPAPTAEVVWPDFGKNALARYERSYELLLRWLAGHTLTTDQRAAAMRASFTRQRLLNEAGFVSKREPAA